MRSQVLQQLEQHVNQCSPVRWQGRVNRVTGNLIESEGPFGCIGEACEIDGSNGVKLAGEIIGFRGRTVLSMMTDAPAGVRLGDAITAVGRRPSVRVGADLL